MKNQEPRWREVAEMGSLQDAAIARGMLEANGIECVELNSTIASVYPMTDTWASLRLLVPADKFEEAIKLLQNNQK